MFRHSKRGEGKGLSEEGRELALRARVLLSPPYDLCVSSPKERAQETMRAFGFERSEVDEAFTAVNPGSRSTERFQTSRKCEALFRLQCAGKFPKP